MERTEFQRFLDAAGTGDLALVKKILNSSNDETTTNNNSVVNEDLSRRVLLHAVAQNQLEIVKYLVLYQGDNYCNTDTIVGSALERAVWCGQTDMVKILCGHLDGDVDYSHTMKLACRFGQLEIVQYLEQKTPGAVMTVQLEHFHEAAKAGHVHVIQYIFEFHQSAHAFNGEVASSLALFGACQHERLEVIEYLCSTKGAANNANFINARVTVDGKTWTALAVACYKGHLAMVKQLCRHGADVNSNNSNQSSKLNSKEEDSDESSESEKYYRTSPLAAAIKSRSPQKRHVIEFLLQTGASVYRGPSDTIFLVHFACGFCRDVSILELLFHYGAWEEVWHPDQHGYTALMWATIHNSETTACEIIEYLCGQTTTKQEKLRLLAAHDNNGLTALDHACAKGDEDLVKLFVRQGAAVTGNTLRAAIQHGHLPIVQFICDSATNIDMNAIIDSETGKMALHLASESSNMELVKYLVDLEGGNPNTPDMVGKTSLHYAVQDYIKKPPSRASRQMLRILVGAGADPFLPDYNGESPLSLLATNNEMRNESSTTAALNGVYILIHPAHSIAGTCLLFGSSEASRPDDTLTS